MKIHQLSVTNFRAYRGTQTITLTPIDGRSFVVIYGENMSGKTGLFLAIQWCLYGSAVGRRGETIPIFAPGANETNFLINASAVEDEDYTMSVQLTWEHGGVIWELSRMTTCHGDPLAGEAFQPTVSLTVDNVVKSRKEVEHQINNILHHDASQFYFFDGELLSQYERWLEQPHEQEKRVRQAVEAIVGTAALRLHTDMEKVANVAAEDQARVVRRSNREERLTDELRERQSRLREIDHELAAYDAQLERLSEESESIQSTYGALRDFEAQQQRLSEIESTIDRETERRDATASKIKQLIRERYWMPLAEAIGSLQSELSDNLGSLLRLSHDQFLHGCVRDTLAANECVICRRSLDQETARVLEARDHTVLNDAATTTDIDSIEQMFSRLTHTRDFESHQYLEQLDSLETELVNARLDIQTYSHRARAIRQEHSDRPRGEIEPHMQRLQKIRETIAVTRQTRAQTETEKENVSLKIDELQRMLNRISIDESVRRKARAARLAVDATKLALESFSERARAEVTKLASRIFDTLISEPGYYGIAIDENYRVLPVNSEGERLPIPSAGGQQLLTLALIGGLNAAAVHEAPIILDTPAGRIDRNNRERVLRWLSSLHQQVVLMVHSGEFTPDEVSATGLPITYAYRITRDQDAGTELRRLEL